MKKKIIFSIVTIIGICLITVAYTLYLIDYIPGFKIILSRGILKDKLLHWLGNTEIIFMGFTALFALLTLKTSKLKPLRDVSFIILAYSQINSTFVNLIFIEDITTNYESLFPFETYYTVLRIASALWLVSIILYIFATIYKPRILKQIALFACPIGLIISFALNTLSRIKRIENLFQLTEVYEFYQEDFLVNLFFTLGSIAIVTSILLLGMFYEKDS